MSQTRHELHGNEQGGMELQVLHAAANKVTWYACGGFEELVRSFVSAMAKLQ